ncbi:hypothetical protein [Streptomyces halstedii]|uniref:Uncharacterized protein n=1 Tax=Streptomyces halstedii TaxID=1944 RepID=A0A6N9U809_STRHA|nr:hypothetical protein [Streptomyces halstedii]NEA19748.1 hypothetical protein [Streptomyces halstedii]
MTGEIPEQRVPADGAVAVVVQEALFPVTVTAVRREVAFARLYLLARGGAR